MHFNNPTTLEQLKDHATLLTAATRRANDIALGLMSAANIENEHADNIVQFAAEIIKTNNENERAIAVNLEAYEKRITPPVTQ